MTPKESSKRKSKSTVQQRIRRLPLLDDFTPERAQIEKIACLKGFGNLVVGKAAPDPLCHFEDPEPLTVGMFAHREECVRSKCVNEFSTLQVNNSTFAGQLWL
ncbi:hypothetical protein AVEN_71842-1 [Araneus ventricosus]|uniref:Uncharacterized protein n=1 Tax=Araneus ventricosus TaxID=182803 RepID=A0A4Y2JBN8_ARAVE|nr:hypothetical protein AVEN_71842-1 [Araneus ventricosus]